MILYNDEIDMVRCTKKQKINCDGNCLSCEALKVKTDGKKSFERIFPECSVKKISIDPYKLRPDDPACVARWLITNA